MSNVIPIRPGVAASHRHDTAPPRPPLTLSEMLVGSIVLALLKTSVDEPRVPIEHVTAKGDRIVVTLTDGRDFAVTVTEIPE